MDIKEPEIFKNETMKDSINEPVTEESIYRCSGEFYEGSYYEYLDPYDQMRWMSGLTVHIENMDDYGFDIYVTDDSPDGGGKIILEQRRAEFAATGYEAVCKGDSESDYSKRERDKEDVCPRSRKAFLPLEAPGRAGKKVQDEHEGLPGVRPGPL